MYLPVYELNAADDLNALSWFTQLRQSAWGKGDAARVVARVIDDVETQGDQAVVRYMRQWTDPNFRAEDICVAGDQMASAAQNLDRSLLDACKKAIDHVFAYQRHIMPEDPDPIAVSDAELGLRFTPVSSVGLAVPGGKAAYPSTVIMLAVPAIVAGVSPQSISVVTPPPTRVNQSEAHAGVSPLVLAVCSLLGIQRVYRIGGAQGIAAIALGTQTVEPVDMIVGPGNIYTQLAKLQLCGRVGIDGFYGPSEILAIVDESANAAFVAADLIAQAEHDPGRCYLVSWSDTVIRKVNQEIAGQLEKRTRRTAIIEAFKRNSAALRVTDPALAVQVADRIAAEHVSLAVENPEQWVGRIRHGGQYFLSDRSPVAAGDYIAGPSHCLPTGTTARYTSGISVYTFLKRSGVIAYHGGMSSPVIDAIDQLARAEGLDGHVASVRVRRSD